MRTEKIINCIIVFILILIFIAFAIFIIANWTYISEPFEFSIEHLAKYKNWGFFYPWKTICYLSFFQIIIMTLLRIYKGLEISRSVLVSILLILISLYFSNAILNFLNISVIYSFDNELLVPASFFFSFYLFFFSVFLFFLKSYKKHRFFLILNIITAFTYVLFFYVYMMLFFD